MSPRTDATDAVMDATGSQRYSRERRSGGRSGADSSRDTNLERRRRRIGSISTHIAAAMLGATLIAAWMGRSPSGGAAPQPSAAADHSNAVHAPPTAFAWNDPPAPSFAIPPFASHLKGLTIVLDPGHVGQTEKGKPKGWKRGPTGLREAEANLRVAQFLREFLETAGANVILTRDRDVDLGLPDDVDLRQRADIGNRADADLFLSIHHNAAASPNANYTTVFYHGGEDRSPASLPAARHILAGLNDALRLEQHLGCAVTSDYALHDGDGFAVLRMSKGPAVLSEASFHSNPEEEQRLRDPLYNRREAYGLFLGIARWAQAGLPSVRLVQPADGRLQRGKQVVLSFDDGVSRRGGLGSQTPKILEDSVVVYLGGERVEATVDAKRCEIRFTPPESAIGKQSVAYVDFETVTGQHVLRPWIPFKP